MSKDTVIATLYEMINSDMCQGVEGEQQIYQELFDYVRSDDYTKEGFEALLKESRISTSYGGVHSYINDMNISSLSDISNISNLDDNEFITFIQDKYGFSADVAKSLYINVLGSEGFMNVTDEYLTQYTEGNEDSVINDWCKQVATNIFNKLEVASELYTGLSAIDSKGFKTTDENGQVIPVTAETLMNGDMFSLLLQQIPDLNTTKSFNGEFAKFIQNSKSKNIDDLFGKELDAYLKSTPSYLVPLKKSYDSIDILNKQMQLTMENMSKAVKLLNDEDFKTFLDACLNSEEGYYFNEENVRYFVNEYFKDKNVDDELLSTASSLLFKQISITLFGTGAEGEDTSRLITKEDLMNYYGVTSNIDDIQPTFKDLLAIYESKQPHHAKTRRAPKEDGGGYTCSDYIDALNTEISALEDYISGDSWGAKLCKFSKVYDYAKLGFNVVNKLIDGDYKGALKDGGDFLAQTIVTNMAIKMGTAIASDLGIIAAGTGVVGVALPLAATAGFAILGYYYLNYMIKQSAPAGADVIGQTNGHNIYKNRMTGQITYRNHNYNSTADINIDLGQGVKISYANRDRAAEVMSVVKEQLVVPKSESELRNWAEENGYQYTAYNYNDIRMAYINEHNDILSTVTELYTENAPDVAKLNAQQNGIGAMVYTDANGKVDRVDIGGMCYLIKPNGDIVRVDLTTGAKPAGEYLSDHEMEIQAIYYENGKYVMEGVKVIGHTGKSSPSGGGGPVNNNLPQLDTSTVENLIASVNRHYEEKYGFSFEALSMSGLSLEDAEALLNTEYKQYANEILMAIGQLSAITDGLNIKNENVLDFIAKAVISGNFSLNHYSYNGGEVYQLVNTNGHYIDYDARDAEMDAHSAEVDRKNREMMEYFNRCLEEDKNRAEETSQSQRNEELRRKSMHDELQMYLETFMQYGVQYEIDRSVDLYSFGSVDEYLEKALKLLN